MSQTRKKSIRYLKTTWGEVLKGVPTSEEVKQFNHDLKEYLHYLKKDFS